jgi:PadR family transcriptional regulator, regulatory protein PadR
MPARIIGLYSLALMDQGPVYGYFISRRISERTGGSWRPGAGAVYPALRALVDRGLARSVGRGRRREYRITPAGRAALRRIRSESPSTNRSAPDLSVLWADVVGRRDLGPFLLQRLRRTIQALETQAGRSPESPGARALRRDLLRELAAAQKRIAGNRRSRTAASGASR